MPAIFKEDDQIYYQFMYDEDKKETLIFIHGIGLDHTVWDSFVPFFQQEYNILTYDLRGHGYSDPGVKKISWQTFYEDLLYLIDTLNILNHQAIHIIGHGFGCNIAARFTLLNPDIVQSLTLLSFTGFYPRSYAEKIRKFRLELSQKESMTSVGQHIIQFATKLPKGSRDFQKLAATYTRVSKQIYFEIVDLMIASRPTRDLHHINVPSLILAGELDLIYPPYLSGLSAFYLSKFNFLIVPDASNMMFIDQPATTYQWIHNFVRKSYRDTGPVQDESFLDFFEELRSKIQVILEEGIKKADSIDELKVELLGTFRVHINGEEILEGWNQRHAKQILVYLLFHPSVTRAQLCDDLWPDVPFSKSRNNLRVYLSHLKKLLDQEASSTPFLVMDHEHIHLKGKVTCDLIDFIEEMETAYLETEVEQKYLLSQKVLNKLPQNPFNELYYDWSLKRRDQLEHKLFQLAKWMGDFHFGKQEDVKALEYYKRASDFNLDDEDIHQKITVLSKR
ncbi:MAG: alpha/beta fold hydrolase [Bacillaceae bacterium]|nr:alpha/beta fold hydrolase [Bacillaceae bacterium]